MATDGRPQGKDVHRLLGRLRALFLAIALAVGFGWQARPGQALEDPSVCAQAVIAVDASGSTASSAFDRQRIALVEAFRHPQLAAAVQDCLPGSLGALVMTWAGLGDQHVCVPWTVLRSAGELAGFAALIERCAYHGGTTDVGPAPEAAIGLLERSPGPATTGSSFS